MRAPRPMLLFSASLVLLAIAVVANVVIIGNGSRPTTFEGALHHDNDTAVFVVRGHAEPGASFEGRLPSLSATPYAFYVTEHGEGHLLLNGTPPHVYHADAQHRSSDYRGFRVERPPLPEGVEPTTTFFGDRVTPIEAVWVFERASVGERFPTDDAGWALFEDWLMATILGSSRTLQVVPSSLPQTQSGFDVAQAVLALGAVGSLVAAGVKRRDPPANVASPRVRDLLALSLVAIVPLGFAGLGAAAYRTSGSPGSLDYAPDLLLLRLFAVWLVGCIALGAALIVEARGLRR